MKNSRPLIIIIFKPKMLVSRSEIVVALFLGGVTEEEALKANPNPNWGDFLLNTTIKILKYDIITEFLIGLN